MPALLLTTGDLEKKAQLCAKEWQNLLKIEKIKF